MNKPGFDVKSICSDVEACGMFRSYNGRLVSCQVRRVTSVPCQDLSDNRKRGGKAWGRKVVIYEEQRNNLMY